MKFLFIILFLFLNSAAKAQITENQAIEIITKLERIYQKMPANSQKFKLKIFFMPQEEYVFGSKGVWGQAHSTGEIFLAGGVLTNQFFTEETFLALACHEVGHLYGGLPWDTSHLSYEGQADYYAANICMKKYYLNYPQELAKKTYLHEHYFKTCQKQYTSKQEIRICVKTMQAGLNLAIASALAINEILLPGPAIDEHYQTDHTLVGRDSPQCIADTFEAGAICSLTTEKSPQSCSNKPKCWFKPTK